MIVSRTAGPGRLERAGSESSRNCAGFTLIELMTVILILAVLTGLAVGVYLVVTNRAKEATAKSNYRIGEDSNTRVFLDCLAEGQESYTGPLGAAYRTDWARYISTQEKKITWVRLARVSNTRLRIYRGYKNGAILYTTTTGAGDPYYYYDFKLAYGKICIYPGYLNAANRWVNDATNRQYITVIALNEKDDRAYYTVFYVGGPVKHGSFHWNSTDGTTSSFQSE